VTASGTHAQHEHTEIIELIRSRQLSYPVASKADFVAQMVQSGAPVVFRGKVYDPEFAAGLMPEFFFPVESERDMYRKAVDLITARGLLPMPGNVYDV